jgi:hypothetical protein
MSAPKPPKTMYHHLGGTITTRTRPGGGFIIEMLTPTRKAKFPSLAMILAGELLLRHMKKELFAGQSTTEQLALDLEATRELLTALDR